MTLIKPKAKLQLRALWAQWSPAACAGLIAAVLVFALVRLITQAGH